MSREEYGPENASKRSRAFDATIRAAVEKQSDKMFARTNRNVTADDVQERLDADVSLSTVRRAMRDAWALGWLRKWDEGSTRYYPGDRAKEYLHSPSA